MAARKTQDLALPLGNPLAAFVPFNGGGPFTLQGDVDLARFLERPVISSDQLGTISAFRVARQNVIQSDLVFPTSMLFGDQFDDQSASLGMPLGGALSVEITCALDAPGDLSGYVATTPWEGVTADPEKVLGVQAYNYVYGFGTAAPGAAAFTLTARANRRVKLGRMIWEAIGAPMDISSIQIAGSELLSGPGSIRIGVGGTSNPWHRSNSDVDGSYLGKWIDGGEAVVITGLGAAGGTIRGGCFLDA